MEVVSNENCLPVMSVGPQHEDQQQHGGTVGLTSCALVVSKEASF
jgi:hypothetical protein